MTQIGGTQMLTNPGFTFFGISGEHKIVPTNQTDLPTWGPNYTEAIICTYDGKLGKIGRAHV